VRHRLERAQQRAPRRWRQRSDGNHPEESAGGLELSKAPLVCADTRKLAHNLAAQRDITAATEQRIDAPVEPATAHKRAAAVCVVELCGGNKLRKRNNSCRVWARADADLK
jgi:hypothetical protein